MTHMADIHTGGATLARCRSLLAMLLISAVCSAGLYATFLDIGDQRYIVTTVTIEDGLPQNSVLCLRQTREGYIWLGTHSGLVRFDGIRLRIFNRWNTPSLKSDRILALYEDSSGSLWVGTDGGGVSRFKDGTWTSYSRRDGLSNDTVRAITEGKDGVTWVGTDNGLIRFEDGNIETISPESLFGCQITSLMSGTDETLWIGTVGCGVMILKKGKLQKLPMGDDFALKEVKQLYRTRSGIIWMATDSGLYRLDRDFNLKGEPLRKTSEENQLQPAHTLLLPEMSIRQILEDRDGSIWVGTDGEGLIKISGGLSSHKTGTISINTRKGLPDDFVYSLLEDREKNLWIGTYTSGLVQLKKAAVRTVSATDGLPENTVHTVISDRRGRLWVATERKGLTVFKDGAPLATVTTENGLTGNRVRTLLLDKDNFLWIGTMNGLNRMPLTDGIKKGIDRIEVLSVEDGPVTNTISALYQDREGTVWVGTAAGLRRFRDGSAVDIKAKALENMPIRTIRQDTEGRIWVGTRNGLFQSEKGFRFTPFPANALQTRKTDSAGSRVTYDVTAILPGKNGDLWVGTNGSGLIRYFKDGEVGGGTGDKGKDPPGGYKFETYTTSQGLPGNNIFSITEDNYGLLWGSTYNGVFRLNPGTRAIALFDESRGMVSRECVMTGHPSAWKDSGGSIYIPTVKGFAIFNPSEHAAEMPGGSGSSDSVLPGVVIEQVMADNRDITRSIERTLPNGTQVVEFQFTALSFTTPGKVTIRYRLEGYDERWQEVRPKQNRRALYLNLPSGDYRFIVVAGNADGAWNREGARFEFSVAAPLLRRLLWGGLVLLLLIFAVFGFWFRRRVQAKKKEEKKAAAPPVSAEVQKDKKYKTSALLPETVQQVLPRLDRLMKEEKIFLEPDISLKNLAGQLNVHYNHLSQIINEQLGKSFNDYINEQRIEEAMKKLADPEQAQKTVLEIAYDTGFYSKSVFNTAFKKFTGITPSQYRKKELKP
jgi:ligand-binding sensor domain-containing protein/AraC-like DNA-binding protein